MPIRHELTLPEEAMLLALHDEKGTLAFGSMVGYAIAGGIIAELVLRMRIDVERVRRSTLVNVVNATPTGDLVLDSALEKMRTAKRRASVQSWVSRLARSRTNKTLSERLRQRGILRRDEGRLLFVFRRDVYPTSDPTPERAAIGRMRSAIFDDAPTDARTAILASLAHAAGLLHPIFGRRELKQRKQRLEELKSLSDDGVATEAAVQAVRDTIKAANAAVIAAVVASSAAASG